MTHHDITEPPFLMIKGDATNVSNNISLGGGSSLGNAATAILFYTGADITTLTGTEGMRLSGAASTVLDFSIAGDRDIILKLASDASLLWVESADHFTTSKAWALTTDDDTIKLLTKIVEIGDWDMDATGSVTIAHGLTDEQTLRSIQCIIRDDPATGI